MHLFTKSRGSAVGTVTSNQSLSPGKVKELSPLHIVQNVQTVSEANPVSYTMGARALSQGVEQPEREDDHAPPTSA
jgi:hypothetical protein